MLLIVGASTGYCQNPKDIQTLTLENNSEKPAPIMRLSNVQAEAFKERILEVVFELTDKISIIGDKEYENAFRREAIEEAVKLFVSDTMEVQVSSANNSNIRIFPIRPYFEHLYALPYYKVKIQFYEIAQVSDLEKAPDGTWVGTAYIYQLFKSYDGEGRLIYKDKTIKRVGISVKESIKKIGDQVISFPEVKLGNIKVVQTR